MSVHIVQISDSHISLQHPQRTRDLANCIEYINTMPEPPDLVIHTGDIAHNGLAAEYAVAKTELDRLTVPFRVLAGNKDKRPELIATFADSTHLSADADFVQYAIDDFDVRLLLLDTLSGLSNKGELCAARWSGLQKMLNDKPLRPSVIFMHHPPFEVAEIPDPFQFEPWSQVDRFQQLLLQYPSIMEVFCGHVHRNISSSVGDIPASALTCMAGDLRKGELDDAERSKPAVKSIRLPA